MRREDPKYVEKRKKFMAMQKAKSQDKFNKGGLTGNQKKLDKNNNNRIDAQDFKILKAEKAKGRGQGLQDEKMKPGKVMKAKMGKATDYKKYLKGLKKATDSVKKDKENKFIKRRIKLMGMPKLSKGGGADTGTVGEIRSKIGVMFNKAKRQGERIMGPKGREERLKKIKGMEESAMNRKNIQRNLASAKDFQKGRRELFKSTAGKKIPAIMGGGMMQKPMGYDDGGRVKNTRGISAIRPRGPAGRAASGPRKMDDILKNYKKFTDSDSGVIIVTKDRDKVKKMGGGMMQKPMGYKSGKSIKVACKLGRNKPTKMY